MTALQLPEEPSLLGQIPEGCISIVRPAETLGAENGKVDVPNKEPVQRLFVVDAATP